MPHPQRETHTPGLEIERKFIVQQLPDLDGVPSVEIDQGYLIIEKRGQLQTRLRRQDETYVLTIKYPSGQQLGHPEGEITLTLEQFETLWPMTEGKRMHKTRYLLPNRTILDIYHGALDGHVVAEVEFDTVEKANDFEPLDWFGEEIRVTDLHFEDGRPHLLYEHI